MMLFFHGDTRARPRISSRISSEEEIEALAELARIERLDYGLPDSALVPEVPPYRVPGT